MSESLPSAVQLFAKAMNVSEKELFKMMERGELVSAEVLPKVAKEMAKAAQAGGALALKLESVRVTQGQFFNEMAISADTVFGNGYSSGLAFMFESLTQALKDNQHLLHDLGNVFGSVFRGITHVVSFVTPIIQGFVSVLDSVAESIEWLSGNSVHKSEGAIIALTGAFMMASKYVKILGVAMYAAFLKPLAILYTILGVFDEIRAFFDESVVGLFDDKSMTPEQSKREHARRRQMFGFESEEDRKLLGSSSTLTERDRALMSGNPMQGGVPFEPMDNPASRSWLASIFGDVPRNGAGMSQYDMWKMQSQDIQKSPVSYVVQNLVIQAPDAAQAKKSFMEGMDAEFAKYRAATN